jgi:hypothetical protein
MRANKVIIAGIVLLTPLVSFATQQNPITAAKDPQGLALLERSLTSMAQSIPADSAANGSIQLVAGGQTSNGTIRILTKGVSESFVLITAPSGTDQVIFSNNQSNEILNNSVALLSLERTQTAQASEFPLAILSALLNNVDGSIQFVGLEMTNGESLNHVRWFDSYASQSQLQALASLTNKDIWFDANSGLPVRISYLRRDGQGATPAIAVDIYFSNYQSSQGVLYPMTIQESLNGTPWATITIQTISFNNGLTDASFPIPTPGVTQ